MIYVDGLDAPCQVRFSKRAKRVRINVRPGLVEVVAPPGTPVRGRHGIEGFVRSKREWIVRSVLKVETRAAALREAEKATQIRYVDGARIPFRGGELVLHVKTSDTRRASVEVGGSDGAQSNVAVVRLVHTTPDAERADAVRKAVLDWTSGLALDDAQRWAQHYGSRLGKHATGIRLGNQKTIWGSCAANGIIRINRKLIEAPPAAMEYVVAHEVAHLAVRNHSPNFWAKLGEIQSDWPERKALLKTWERSRALGRWTVG